MVKIGITGGIGSGKSLVASILRMNGIPVYDADSASKMLIATNTNLQEKLSFLLGKEIFHADGTLNKKVMADKIFKDEILLKETNKIIHPAVISDFLRWADNEKKDVAAVESALLFESGMNHYIDKTIMVYAPLEIRIERAMNRDDANRESIERRIKNQMDDEEKKLLADYTIINDNASAILPQIDLLLKQLVHNFPNSL